MTRFGSLASPATAVMLLALCLASMTHLSTAIYLVECGRPESGLPRCNGTIFAHYTELNCKGNVTFVSDDAPYPVGICNLNTNSGFEVLTECKLGEQQFTRSFAHTTTDRGNCTQQAYSSQSGSAVAGFCLNDYTRNLSSANLCTLDDVPTLWTGTIQAGPVMLRYPYPQACVAPKRCKSMLYMTKFNDEVCGHSTASTELAEITAETGVCYDYRPYSAAAPSSYNIKFSFDGTFFKSSTYLGGCDGPIASTQEIRVNECYVGNPGTSSMYTYNRPYTPNSPPSDSSLAPSAAPEAWEDSIRAAVFVSVLVSAISWLL